MSPAEILRFFLIGEALVDDPGVSSPTWPAFLSHEPDAPDECVTLTDTVGVKDGRLMEGSNILHHGVQVRVRSKTFSAGWTLMGQVAAALEAVVGEVVSPSSGENYTLANVSQQGPINFIGLEEGTKRRFLFTLNFLITIN